MNSILESIKPVICNSEHVKINESSLKKVCSNFNPDGMDYWMDASPIDLSKLNDHEKLNFIFIFTSINFCYWGDPKWKIKYQNKLYDGAWAMIGAIKKAIDNTIPVLDANYLSCLTKTDLLEILKGNTVIPLFDERLKILQENGKILSKKYNGQFVNIINEADKNALKILDILTNEFPSYNDCAIYNGQKVLFHKRAQLAIFDIYRTFKGCGFGNLKNIDQLTTFADYKIPQSLCKLGILEYSPELSKSINKKSIILAGSKKEIEIRANMIWAIELMKKELRPVIPNITSVDIDSYLWLLGQNKSSDDKPYHRTKTIWY